MRKEIDVVNNRYGKLVVLNDFIYKNNNKYWKCICDCGNFTFVKSEHLRNNRIKSCGCIKIKNLEGMKFNRLIVIELYSTKNGQAYWLCQCDCGNLKIIRSDSLVSGMSKSCGCYNKEIATKHGESYTSEYKSFMARKYRELKSLFDTQWTIKMESSIREFQKSCVVCGSKIKLSIDHVLPLSNGNGLYPGNAVVLCNSCNSKKWKHNLENLNKHARDKITKAAQEFKEYWESEC